MEGKNLCTRLKTRLIIIIINKYTTNSALPYKAVIPRILEFYGLTNTSMK